MAGGKAPESSYGRFKFNPAEGAVENPQEAQQIWQNIKRRRYAPYEELRRSQRSRQDRQKNERIRLFRQGSTDLWNLDELADVILDDGSYIDQVLCYGDHAMGILIGGHTGFLPFTDCEETRGPRIVNFLKWKRRHAFPAIARILRRRWARRHGVAPVRQVGSL